MIFFVLQIVLFIPFFLMWINDCKEIGKDVLAVSLGERFLAWVIFFPIWIIAFMR